LRAPTTTSERARSKSDQRNPAPFLEGKKAETTPIKINQISVEHPIPF